MLDISSAIELGNEVISRELYLSLPPTEIKILNKSEWGQLQKRRNLEKAEGIYFPFTDNAYFSEGVTLPVFIHEYFGHGLFCTRSEIGKALVEEEKISRESSSFDKSQKDLETFVAENLSVYEGFAIWMEDFILNKISAEIWREREDLHRENEDFFKRYERMKNVEMIFGPLSLIYGVGFPKNFSRLPLLKLVEENVKDNFDNIEFLFLYGSRKEERDIDMVAVYPDFIQLDGKNKFTGDLDLAQFNRTDFLTKLFYLDIEKTEPVWTGELLVSRRNFNNIKEALEKAYLTKDSIKYIKRRVLETFNLGQYFLNEATYEHNKFLINNVPPDEALEFIVGDKDANFESMFPLFSLTNLSYALSYKSSLQRYLSGADKVLYHDIIEQPSFPSDHLLFELNGFIKNLKIGKNHLNEKDMQRFLEDTRKVLIK